MHTPLRTLRRPVPTVPGQLRLPDPPPPHGDCPCGHDGIRPGWCGLRHHGLGCHSTDTLLVSVPQAPGSPRTFHVCTRCAARARWWQTEPDQRPTTYTVGPLGRCVITEDDDLTPIGRRPPYAKP